MEDDECVEGMEMEMGGHHHGGGGHAGYGADEDDRGQEMEDVEVEGGEEARDEEITQEDAWAVISAYLEEKGLVCQQVDSFDEFIQNTMQGIVDKSADIEIRLE